MIMQTHTEALTAVPTRRAHSLDALRGYAIMTMILAATEAFGILPAWMYHAQEPPPTHVFNPHIYGITWVDLIFPFFLFSMGAAIPLSLGRQLEKGTGKLKLLKKTIIRWMKLTFFAIFVIHVYPYMLGYPAPWMNELVALAAFALMFLIFMRNPFHLSKWGNRTMNTLAYAAAVALLVGDMVEPRGEREVAHRLLPGSVSLGRQIKCHEQWDECQTGHRLVRCEQVDDGSGE